MHTLVILLTIAIYSTSLTANAFNGRRPQVCRSSCCANKDCGSGSVCLNPSTPQSSCIATSGQATVSVARRIPLQEEPFYWRYHYDSKECNSGQCSKLVIFFSGGEMNCDEGFDDPHSVYSKVLNGYTSKGYLAVCIGLFLNGEAGGVLPFNQEASRVDLAIKTVRESSEVKKLWDGSNLLFAGVSHGATAPVIAMARTEFDEKAHWKGSRNTAACFHDGIYDPILQDKFFQDSRLQCRWLRDRGICGRYFGSESCSSISTSMRDVELDRVTQIPSSNFSIMSWKLIECGSQLPACSPAGDWISAEPIGELCTKLKSGRGRSCVFDSQPSESHVSCVSSPTGISKCRDWFDGLVRK